MRLNVFDFSNMPIDHKSFTNDTRNVPGLYKNENPYVDYNSRDSDDFIIEWFGRTKKFGLDGISNNTSRFIRWPIYYSMILLI